MFRYNVHLNSIYLQEIGIGIIWLNKIMPSSAHGSTVELPESSSSAPGSGRPRQRIGGCGRSRHHRCPGTVHDDPRGLNPRGGWREWCVPLENGNSIMVHSGSHKFKIGDMFFAGMLRCKPAHSDLAILLVRIRMWPMFLQFLPNAFLSIYLVWTTCSKGLSADVCSTWMEPTDSEIATIFHVEMWRHGRSKETEVIHSILWVFGIGVSHFFTLSFQIQLQLGDSTPRRKPQASDLEFGIPSMMRTGRADIRIMTWSRNKSQHAVNCG